MGNRSARIFIPVGRPHLERLRTSPHLLSLYVLLADRCDKARFGQQNHDDTVFYRGYMFERIEANTYICNLDNLAAELRLQVQELTIRLCSLYECGCLECLVFVTGCHVPDDPDMAYHTLPENLTIYGYPLNEFVEGGIGYAEEDWYPTCFVRITRYKQNGKGEPKRVPFVQVPQAAVQLSEKQLRFLLYVYNKAVFTHKERIYNNQSYLLHPGELVASYREIGRALEEDHTQIRRWAKSAEKMALLKKIPSSRTDALWKVALPPQLPKEAQQ